MVRLKQIQLRQRNLNINLELISYFNRIIKVFEDFRLMAQLREEMDRLKNPALALAVSKTQTNN